VPCKAAAGARESWYRETSCLKHQVRKYDLGNGEIELLLAWLWLQDRTRISRIKLKGKDE
jgi:hypothetical protein